jgi:hypothetical protein
VANVRRSKISTRQPKRRLGTAEARDHLRELASFARPAGSLADRAVELGPRRETLDEFADKLGGGKHA